MIEIGDTVKILQHDHWYYKKGEIGTVIKNHPDQDFARNYVCIKTKNSTEDGGLWIHVDDLELISLECTCGEAVCANCKQYRGN